MSKKASKKAGRKARTSGRTTAKDQDADGGHGPSGGGFSGGAMQLLRNLAGKVGAIDAKRKAAMENKNDAFARRSAAGSAAAKQQAKIDHSDSICEIQTLARAREATINKIIEVCTDQDGLFDGKTDYTIAQLAALGAKSKKDEDQQELYGDDDDDDDDDAWAQADTETAPRKPRAKTPVLAELAGVPEHDGINEHLKASVTELGFPESITAALNELRIATVGHLHDMITKEWSTAALVRLNLGCTLAQASDVMKTVAKFVKDHRRAIIEAEQGDAA